MHDLPLLPLIGVVLTFLLAGFVKGVIGLGLPTVAVGVLSLFMLPVHAAMLLVIPSFVTNVWQMAAGPSFPALLRRLWLMMVGVFTGTWLGIGFMTGSSSELATAALGAALTLYAVLGLGKVRFAIPPRAEPWVSPLVGLLTGVVTGATGVFVIPAVPYLQALNMGKEDLIQALGLSFTVSTVALALGLADGGTFEASYAMVSLLALAPALAGMFVGQRIRLRVEPEVFRLCFFLGLLALGIHLGLRPLL